MRVTTIAAAAGVLSGLAWLTAGVLSWQKDGLTDTGTVLWWAGVGLFVLASACTGYAAVTSSPLWLRAVVFVGAGALGSVISVLDTTMSSAYLVVGAGGLVVALVSLAGFSAGRARDGDGEDGRHGRRAAR